MNNTDSDWEYEKKENSRKNKNCHFFMEYFI